MILQQGGRNSTALLGVGPSARARSTLAKTDCCVLCALLPSSWCGRDLNVLENNGQWRDSGPRDLTNGGLRALQCVSTTFALRAGQRTRQSRPPDAAQAGWHHRRFRLSLRRRRTPAPQPAQRPSSLQQHLQQTNHPHSHHSLLDLPRYSTCHAISWPAHMGTTVAPPPPKAYSDGIANGRLTSVTVPPSLRGKP